MTIAEYLIQKLTQHNCKYVFGVPGTSCSDLYNTIDQSDGIDYVVTVNELEAGYMADGYGRNGHLACVCVAYGVGTLSMVNAIAGAYTEKVPVVVLNGGPTHKDTQLEERLKVLYAHSTGNPSTDYKIFKEITIAAEVVADTQNAADQIDRLFETCVKLSGPVYLEIPQDFWLKEINVKKQLYASAFHTNPRFDDVLAVVTKTIRKAQHPVMVIGPEIQRLGLTDKVLALLEKWQMPFATTLLSKSVLPESHPLYVGCYDSDLFPKPIHAIMENADCLLGLGNIWGIDQRYLVNKLYHLMIDVGYNHVRVGHLTYDAIATDEFIEALHAQEIPVQKKLLKTAAKTDFNEKRNLLGATAQASEPFGHEQIFSALNAYLKNSQGVQVVVDTCLASFPAADLDMPDTHMFSANPIWLSIGQGTPAAVGAYLSTQKAPIIITGDGGFRMVAQTFSTMVKYNIPALIVILDNSLYAIEQFLIDPTYFENEGQKPLRYVELNRWAYEKFPEVYGGGYGQRILNKPELENAFKNWNPKGNGPTILACQIPPNDLPIENKATTGEKKSTLN